MTGPGEFRPDVVVVGAGIVGASCAFFLSREGLRVTVLESGFSGGGATSSAMGHVVVMDDSEPQLALTAFSRRLWTDLAPELSPECEDDPCGTLWVAADEEEMGLVEHKAAAYRAHGVQAEVLDARQTAEAEPNLRPGLAGSLLVPGDRVLYPPNTARWLLERARRLGAEVREGWPVESLGPRRVVSPKGVLEADVVINAAGVEAPRLTPGLAVEPRKGHLVITDRAPGFCGHQIVELGYLKSARGAGKESVAFNVQPRITGQLLIGSSREFVGWDDSINRVLVARMLRRAIGFLPGLARLSAIRTWVGFRPATPDKLPLIGRWEPVEGLFVAAGHEGLGITTAPGTAALLTDLILGRRPALDSAPFDPMREVARA